jgi:hypothetical protein
MVCPGAAAYLLRPKPVRSRILTFSNIFGVFLKNRTVAL